MWGAKFGGSNKYKIDGVEVSAQYQEDTQVRE